jgi:hypothetical protein
MQNYLTTEDSEYNKTSAQSNAFIINNTFSPVVLILFSVNSVVNFLIS